MGAYCTVVSRSTFVVVVVARMSVCCFVFIGSLRLCCDATHAPCSFASVGRVVDILLAFVRRTIEHTQSSDYGQSYVHIVHIRRTSKYVPCVLHII